ncbi:ATP-binding protein [Carnobacteriaceae bacterium 52-44]
MNRIKRRLYGIYFFIVAMFVLLLYFMISNVIEGRIEEQQRERLSSDIVSLTEYIDTQNIDQDTNAPVQEEMIEILDEIAPVVNERITFLDSTGQPLYDSSRSVQEIENLFNYSEVQQVLSGETIGVAHRDSDQSPQSVYFVAQTIYDESNQPIGILRLASEITDLTDMTRLSIIIQLIGTVVLAILLFILSRNWISQITNPINKMKTFVKKLPSSEYELRYTGHSYEEIDALGDSINELAENLEQQQIDLKTSEERIYSLINHLIIGVMLLDENRCIRIVNPVMNELLGVNLYGKISHLYTDYVKSAELIELIEESYVINEAVNSEILIYFPEEKTLDANVVPVPGKEQGEQSYIVLLYDITEIRRLENIRTDFAANVSHELRTPITALKGFSETLLDGAMYDEEVLIEFLEIMLKESTRLDSMVQDILQLSKLEQRKVSVSNDWIRIREVTEEIFQILQQKIELKQMSYSIEEKTPVSIFTNREQLKQVLMNLIANAITYTPEKGTVIVDISQVADEAQIQIIDSGIGIPEKERTRIFERFYRVDKARSRNSGGTGLGLSIVKWLVDSMNGQIELYSEVNVGTTFKVILPIENN